MTKLPPSPWSMLHRDEIRDVNGGPVAYVRASDEVKRLFLAAPELLRLLRQYRMAEASDLECDELLARIGSETDSK